MRKILSPPILALAFLPATVMAGEPQASEDPLIWGGTETEQCAWPTTVAVQNGGSLCTGTLIHPQLVVYAAHCGASGTQIRFGERTATAKSITPEFCQTNTGYSNQGNDWAFCKLSYPIDMPVTPTIWGDCETGILTPGANIAIAGFGNTNGDVGAGTKRWAMTVLNSVSWGQNVVTLGGSGNPSVCSGDSGGPAFIRNPLTNHWHAFGIASTVTGGCGGFGTHSLIPGAIPWIEQQTDLDLTQCFDANGGWDPNELCNDMYSGEPGVGYGTWSGSDPATWCEGTPSTDWLDYCGPSFVEMDEEGPMIQFVEPMNNAEYDGPTADLEIDVDWYDDSGTLKEVRLYVNSDPEGEPDIVNAIAPFNFNGGQFPEGQYTMHAVAEDHAGNIAMDTVVFGVGVEPPDPPAETGGDGDGDGDGDGEGGTIGLTAGMDEDGSADGCNCSADRGAGATPWAALGLFGLLAWRRRR